MNTNGQTAIIPGLRALAGTVMALTLSAAAAAQDDPAPVQTQSGPVMGQMDGDVRIFRGIPYAAPPVGEARWTVTGPPAPWTDVLAADAFGPACVQPQRPGRRLALREQSEDCLSLNIWAPATQPDEAAERPVMVWIHGGAFRFGAGSLPYYDGSAFARSGVILVTINYRLGRLGFFAHPALRESGGGGVANFGLADQRAALQWVQDNIAAFGGDPDNVTVFGESAGGASILYHLATPAAQGLFDKAVVESGGGYQLPAHAWEDRPGRPALSEADTAWAASVLPDGSASDLAALRALPAETVVASGPGPVELGAYPVVDDATVPREIYAAFSAGEQVCVPLMIGANSDEGSLMAATGAPAENVLSRLGGARERAMQLYADAGDEADIARTIFADASFVAPARWIADRMEATCGPTWLYHFDYVPERMRNTVSGVAHGFEVPFVFDTLETLPGLGRVVTPADHDVAEAVNRAWSGFARSGDPGWPTFGEAGNTLLVDAEGWQTVNGLHAERLDFQDTLFAHRFALLSQTSTPGEGRTE